ncbi:MAG TPA: hypothetical protein VMB85_03055 [Bryobacteraceae bacterium]|nr:hypothetical protein [Bryobacteraceae bacterium]
MCFENTFERHYRISELAQLWGPGREIRKLGKDDPGVMKARMGRKKAHTTYSKRPSLDALERLARGGASRDFTRDVIEFVRAAVGRFHPYPALPSFSLAPDCSLLGRGSINRRSIFSFSIAALAEARKLSDHVRF